LEELARDRPSSSQPPELISEKNKTRRTVRLSDAADRLPDQVAPRQGAEDRRPGQPEPTVHAVNRTADPARAATARATTTNLALGSGQAAAGPSMGNYRLRQMIGEGGMGRVYRAEHKLLGRVVAIKVLRATAAGPGGVARFFQEARVVNQIRHRNIVDVADFVELDDGTAFIVMELLEGTSLRELFEGGGALEPHLLVSIALQVCEALEATHAIGVVHRDLKPANIFICADRSSNDWVKLLDFGVAKLNPETAPTDAAHDVHTYEGTVLGTPPYMSPEQARGGNLDGRSDIYALGAIMYELLCGEPMFQARSLAEFREMHASVEPTPLRQRGQGTRVSRTLDAIVARCLRKAPADRFASAKELRDELEAELARLGGAANRPGTARVARRAGLGLALAAAAGLALWFGWSASAAENPTPPQTAGGGDPVGLSERIPASATPAVATPVEPDANDAGDADSADGADGADDTDRADARAPTTADADAARQTAPAASDAGPASTAKKRASRRDRSRRQARRDKKRATAGRASAGKPGKPAASPAGASGDPAGDSAAPTKPTPDAPALRPAGKSAPRRRAPIRKTTTLDPFEDDNP